jgi:hypothetical protein
LTSVKAGERKGLHYRRMARFHFDVSRDGEPWSEDDLGVELDSPEAALREAVALAHSLLRDRPTPELAVQVRDGDPVPLLTVRVSTLVEGRVS